MRILKVFIPILLLSAMALLTAFCYLPEVGLVGGSIQSMEHRVTLNPIVPTMILMVGVIAVYVYSKNRRIIYFILFAISVGLWILSGRQVSTIVTDDRVITGWFCVPNYTIHLCENKSGCDTVLDHTTLEKLSFWRIKIKNHYIDETVFIGPFIWSRAVKLFNENIGANSTSKYF